MYRVDTCSVKILINNVHVYERYSIGKKEREAVYLSIQLKTLASLFFQMEWNFQHKTQIHSLRVGAYSQKFELACQGHNFHKHEWIMIVDTFMKFRVLCLTQATVPDPSCSTKVSVIWRTRSKNLLLFQTVTWLWMYRLQIRLPQ